MARPGGPRHSSGLLRHRNSSIPLGITGNHFGQIGAKLGQRGRLLPLPGPFFVDAGPLLAEFGRCRIPVDHVSSIPGLCSRGAPSRGPPAPKLCAMTLCAHPEACLCMLQPLPRFPGHPCQATLSVADPLTIWAVSGRYPKSAARGVEPLSVFVPCYPDPGPTRAELCRLRAMFRRVRANIGRMWSFVGRSRATFCRVRPIPGQLSPRFPEVAPNVAQVQPNSICLGPISAEVAPGSAKFLRCPPLGPLPAKLGMSSICRALIPGKDH